MKIYFEKWQFKMWTVFWSIFVAVTKMIHDCDFGVPLNPEK